MRKLRIDSASAAGYGFCVTLRWPLLADSNAVALLHAEAAQGQIRDWLRALGGPSLVAPSWSERCCSAPEYLASMVLLCFSQAERNQKSMMTAFNALGWSCQEKWIPLSIPASDCHNWNGYEVYWEVRPELLLSSYGSYLRGVLGRRGQKASAMWPTGTKSPVGRDEVGFISTRPFGRAGIEWKNNCRPCTGRQPSFHLGFAQYCVRETDSRAMTRVTRPNRASLKGLPGSEQAA